MSARPWCCPEPRCTPLHLLAEAVAPGDSFVCFGKAPEIEFTYDGVTHVNDLRSCHYTPLKGLIAYQENRTDWEAIRAGYWRALTALAVTEGRHTMNDTEALAEELTTAILKFYGYTDVDLAEAEQVHPGRVCSDECWDEDGETVHPPAYDEAGATASTVVEIVLPWFAARVTAAREAAWLEGYSDGRLDEAINSETDNPYAAPVLPAAAATEGDTP